MTPSLNHLEGCNCVNCEPWLFDKKPDTPKPGIPLNESQPARDAIAEILADPDHAESCCGQPGEADCIIDGLSDRGFVVREARGIPPAEEFVANAGLSCCPHTEPAALSEHKDDSYGGCVVCREYVAHTDDETRPVAWPCAVVRLAAGIPLIDVELLARALPSVFIDLATMEARLAFAARILARLASESSIPVEEGDR